MSLRCSAPYSEHPLASHIHQPPLPPAPSPPPPPPPLSPSPPSLTSPLPPVRHRHLHRSHHRHRGHLYSTLHRLSPPCWSSHLPRPWKKSAAATGAAVISECYGQRIESSRRCSISALGTLSQPRHRRQTSRKLPRPFIPTSSGGVRGKGLVNRDTLLPIFRCRSVVLEQSRAGCSIDFRSQWKWIRVSDASKWRRTCTAATSGERILRTYISVYTRRAHLSLSTSDTVIRDRDLG